MINGINLLTDYKKFVDMVGICPQENILLEKMSVQENLEFFGRFKNVENLDEQIVLLLEQFNLTRKAHEKSEELSGGQKRKLQLMIALLGK
jgi:ATP-binding cassette subfamily A (ABC1) protein 3